MSEDVPVRPSKSITEQFRHRLKMIGAAITVFAAIGAVVGGLAGYWTAWKTISSDILRLEQGKCDEVCRAKCIYQPACIAKWEEINAKGLTYARQKENELRQADPKFDQRMNAIDCQYHTSYCKQ
jgi:hypothetical protein